MPKTYYIPATHQTRLEFFSFKNKSIVSTAGIRQAPTAHATLCAGRRASGPHLSLPLPSPPLASPSQSSPCLPSSPLLTSRGFPISMFFSSSLHSQGFWPPPLLPPPSPSPCSTALLGLCAVYSPLLLSLPALAVFPTFLLLSPVCVCLWLAKFGLWPQTVSAPTLRPLPAPSSPRLPHRAAAP